MNNAAINTYDTAAEAITRSVSHTEIVTLKAYDAEVEEDLLVECDDNVEANGVVDYWGTDEDGNGWRVIMPAGPSDDQIQALKEEAYGAGDADQMAICDRALAGEAAARTECASVIASAAAMGE